MLKSTTRFGPFTLDEANGLVRAGKPVEIGQKALSLLWELTKADGQPVSKDKLMEACWPGSVVEEGNLTVQIAALRKALGATDDGLDWIVTVPRVGYRLPQRQAPATDKRSGTSHRRSITIMPFRNLSADKDNDYFAASLAAEVTSALARYKSLSVQMAIEQLEGEAGHRATQNAAGYRVEGSAMKSGDRLRIVVSLLDGSDNSVIWNERFDADMANIFAVQDNIAATVASRVEPAISDQEMERVRRKTPANLSAYDLYLKARHLHFFQGGQDAMNEAYGLLKQALELDAHDVLSVGQMCNLLNFTVSQGMKSQTDDDRKWGEFYARRTIELARDDARMLVQGASGLLHMSNDAEGALAAAESAYVLNPNDWQVAAMSGTVHLLCGDIDKAVERYSLEVRHGAASVASRYSRTGLAHAMNVLGEYEKAIEWANGSMTVSNSFPSTYWSLIAANARLGRMETARMWLDALLAKWPDATVASIRTGQPKFKPERIEPILQGLAMAGLPEK